MQFLKIQDVLNSYDIRRPAFWRWRKDSDFPTPITPPNARPMWRLVDIENWENKNVEKSSQN